MSEIDNKNLEQPGVETPEENNNQQYIDAIRELQSNTVSKDKYNKLVEENKNLLNSLVNGDIVAAAAPEQPKKSIEELRNELFRPKKELNNLQYIEKALELRERVLEETGEDCFVSQGHNITPTEDSYKAAQKIADIYQECIDYANGDSAIFTNELMRRVADNPLANKNINRTKNRR